MSENELLALAGKFIADDVPSSITKCESGHINSTYQIEYSAGGETKRYILQKINSNVFKKPVEVMENIVNVTDFLRKKINEAGGDAERETLTLINSIDGVPYYTTDNGEVWRMYKSVPNARTYESVERPKMFYNAAYAFGNFQRLLSDFPADILHETIPNFHNTVSRFEDFKAAVDENAAGRLRFCEPEVEFIRSREGLCHKITDGIASGIYPLRVTHNDTKLNNVMLDLDTDEGVCVIDLDTVMPGSVLYDFGDAVRFGASNAAEDERDLSKVFLRLDLFEEFTRGFLHGLGGSLTEEEVRALPTGALVITLEIGMRFLADFLNGDVYFAVHRENHNLDRARTQLALVADMEKKLPEMAAIVEKYI